MNCEQFLEEYSARETEAFKKKLAERIGSAKSLVAQVDEWWGDSIKALVILGETPTWNDGEECIHADRYSVFYQDGSVSDRADILSYIDENYYCFTEDGESKKAEQSLQRLKEFYGETVISLAFEVSYTTEEKSYEKNVYGERVPGQWERPVIGTETVTYKVNKFAEPEKELRFETSLAQKAFDTNYIVVFTRENNELRIEIKDIEPRW